MSLSDTQAHDFDDGRIILSAIYLHEPPSLLFQLSLTTTGKSYTAAGF